MMGKPRGGAPIGLQLVALLVICLLATHVIAWAILVATPPPRPPLYRMAEIAQALNGGALDSRFGRPLRRTVVDQLPEDLVHAPPRMPPGEVIAAALNRPADDVRFAPKPPSLLESFLGGPGGPGRRRLVFERHMGHPPPPGMPHGPHGRPEFHVMFGFAREIPVVGEFSAALRRPDGRWTVVRSSPEPFPTEWQRRALLPLLAGFIVVLPAGLLFARRITTPLKRFSEAAERLGRDPHAPPVALSGPAEIGAAAEAFNNMQGRLKRYIDDRTAMVGAISHDLRTPLARIRFKLEGAPPDLRQSIAGDVGQMEQMIQGVLTFIRNESTPRRREKLDLLSLVECVADDAALVGGDVEIIGSQPVTVEGDPVALQRLFVNLVDNALKYGGEARIQVRPEGEQAVVEIADGGEGLSDEDLERVFQPFYRADPSRNVDAGGIGLGLPIARSTARAHGGDVELKRGAKGLKARVTLPIA
jgi:signal transduction histidine kinase